MPSKQGGQDVQRHAGEIPRRIEPSRSSPIDQGPESSAFLVNQHVGGIEVAVAEHDWDIRERVRSQRIQQVTQPPGISPVQQPVPVNLVHPRTGIDLWRLAERPQPDGDIARILHVMDTSDLPTSSHAGTGDCP